MKIIKKITTLAFLLIFFSLNVFSQKNNKWRAEQFTFKIQMDETTWSEWEEWKPTNIYVVIDDVKNRITIYSQKHQVYDIISSADEVIIDDKIIISFYINPPKNPTIFSGWDERCKII